MAVHFKKNTAGKTEAKADNVVGTVSVSSAGKETKESVVVGSVVEAPVMANVGVRMSRTINLGNFDSAKVEVSLYVPCAPHTKAIEAGYKLAVTWVDSKMAKLVKDVEDGK